MIARISLVLNGVSFWIFLAIKVVIYRLDRLRRDGIHRLNTNDQLNLIQRPRQFWYIYTYIDFFSLTLISHRFT